MNPSYIECTSPGKLILFGEHAVVYGKKSVATALSDLRTTVKLFCDNEKAGTLEYYAPCVGIDHDIKINFDEAKEYLSQHMKDETIDVQYPTFHIETFKPNRKIIECLTEFTKKIYFNNQIVDNNNDDEHAPKIISAVAVLYLCLLLTPKLTFGIRVELSTKSPIGAGLGSSAAFAVCLVSAFLLLFKSDIISQELINKEDENTLEIINRWAYFCECLIHGTPSGIDNSVATYGGVLSFANGKVVEHLSPKILPSMRILIVNTKVERNTKLIVQKVREQRELNKELIDEKLNEIQQISENYLNLLRNNFNNHQHDTVVPFTNELRHSMEQFIDRNHILLNEIGTGHPKLELICEIASKHGLHAKLTGAGGGGCGFVLLEDCPSEKEDLLKQDLLNEGFEYFMSNEVAGKGIYCEQYK
ncbi:hypothetical protein ABK040_010035 [Willaertia magna]